MQITHDEAHRLIQFSMDQDLKPQEKNTLQTHLENCTECRSFAEDLKEVKGLLLPMMRKHWNLQPIPLSLETITDKRRSQIPRSTILVTRTAIISIVFAAFIFSTWQFTHSGNRTSTPMPLNILPIPTPSGESTSTIIIFQSCAEMKYQVQETDTLESIASQFSVAKDKIMAINNMSNETVNTKMELMIPVCHFTPTSTVYPSTLATTFTPVIGSTTSAPGG